MTIMVASPDYGSFGMNHSAFVSSAARGVGLSLVLAASMAACSSGDRLTVGHEVEARPASAAASPDPGAAHRGGAESNSKAALHAAIDDLHQPRRGLYTAGQPEASAWQAAADSGITTVINLRPAAEMGGRDEAAEVAAAGLAYFEMPVAAAGDINMANAMALKRLIDAAPGPVLVHCASGNRVGALLALGEMESRDLTVEQALAFGRSAGLGSLEPRVREVLDAMPVSTCKADASC